jgi:hypothetical protein
MIGSVYLSSFNREPEIQNIGVCDSVKLGYEGLHIDLAQLQKSCFNPEYLACHKEMDISVFMLYCSVKSACLTT